jgi:hypothetical protein
MEVLHRSFKTIGQIKMRDAMLRRKNEGPAKSSTVTGIVTTAERNATSGECCAATRELDLSAADGCEVLPVTFFALQISLGSASRDIGNSWNSGFTASVTLTNTGTAAWTGWTLRFNFANGQRRGVYLILWHGHMVETAKTLVVEWPPELRVIKRARSLGPQLRPALICTAEGQRYTESGFRSTGTSCL